MLTAQCIVIRFAFSISDERLHSLLKVDKSPGSQK